MNCFECCARALAFRTFGWFVENANVLILILFITGD
jgi:hypothetical protein